MTQVASSDLQTQGSEEENVVDEFYTAEV